MAGTGGYRPGAGRKKAAVEEDVKGAINRALEANPEALNDIWNKVIQKAKDGSEKHITIFLNYYYGKPKETVKMEHSGEIENTVALDPSKLSDAAIRAILDARRGNEAASGTGEA